MIQCILRLTVIYVWGDNTVLRSEGFLPPPLFKMSSLLPNANQEALRAEANLQTKGN